MFATTRIQIQGTQLSHLRLGLSTAAYFFLLFFSWAAQAQNTLTVSAARIWPASEYTRITLESKQAIRFNQFTIDHPDRVVLDLENVELSAILTQLPAKIAATDPYIKALRVGRFKPDVVRLVFDLKTEAKPTVFTTPPVGAYGYRLVLDIYPAHPADPLLALMQTDNAKDAAAGISAQAPTSAKTENVFEDKSKQDRVGENKSPAKSELPEAKTPEIKNPEIKNPEVKITEAKKSASKTVDAKKKELPELIRLVTVAIDAGHGGEDPGAKGRNGTYEKEVTLSIAKRVKAQLDEEPNTRGFLTRDGDYFIPLGNRVVKARKVAADLFVSIHADAFINSDARGSSVFALSDKGASSAAARWLAKRENEADLIGGVNLDVKDVYLKQTLLDLSQTATINDSMKLGRAVLSELGGINTLHKGSVEQAGFAVLKAPDIPSILVETAFITNPEEEARLSDETYQDKLAAAIVAGIKRYFANNPPLAKPKLARN